MTTLSHGLKRELSRCAKTVPTCVLLQLAALDVDAATMVRLLDAASRGSNVTDRRREMFGEPK